MKSFGEFSHDLQEKNVPDNPALWKKAIAKAKAKFDVYPSAYANAWAAKWYKGEGGTWSVKKEEVEVREEDEDKKPLMTWFAQFEKELKKSGGKYKDVDPTDMLKLYYKGIKPKVAAKQLTAGYDIAEASFADRMIVKQGRGPGSGVAKSTNIGLVLPKTPEMEKKIQAVLEKDAATRRKMSNLVVGREDREKEFVLYFKSAQGRKTSGR